MSPARALARVGLAGCLAAALAAPGAARAQGADPDSALGDFLGGLADSTDAYFGLSALPVDTTGLDSALAAGAASAPRRRRLAAALAPAFRFNRVDGAVWGAAAGLGNPGGSGRLGGSLRWAAGPNQWLGDGDFTIARPFAGQPVRLRLGAGRTTDAMDRDAVERRLTTLRALVFGSDRKRYLRRDGFEAGLDRESEAWRVGFGYRDRLERPLAVTTGWNLMRDPLEVPDNLPAVRGRAREFRWSGGFHLPFTPFDLEVSHLTSSRSFGSDFEYRRTRATLGADLGLGRWFSGVPQLVYGRLSGEATPQQAFYLGGTGSLRGLPGASRGGAGIALARFDLVCVADVLALARVPHPAAFPVMLGGFAAAGAVWGRDPYLGVSRPGVDWPHAADWVPEAGLSVLYQPGLPDPSDFVRIDVAWPLGPGGLEPRLSVSYTRAVDLLRPLRR
jgi:hypothetical protein